ncbi:Trk-type K+ transport system, membrane component [Ignavigranum ruoffiae]|uniref:Trk-type K+ transport system, membrane component n=2 Tax=Ignavigranum ruoffiae TaxID=89093 RepID=A0A1H8YUN8_9LACT|nr:Trk-type K+ transport system, membrane component [Ignavigranum ruoffiae]
MTMKKLIDNILGTEAKKIAFSFFIVIFTGSVLLSLPISNQVGSQASYFDHLFMATSMVCVTGLSTVAVVDTYTIFGQIVSMFLMQIGGLSLMTFVSISFYYLRHHVSLKNQYLVQSTINRKSNYDLKDFVLTMLKFTFMIEGGLAVILATQLIPIYGVFKGIFSSIYIAISAFNNAGFDNLGSTSLLQFKDNPIVLLPIAITIVFAGLGFSVWYELKILKRKFFTARPMSLKLFLRRISIHSRTVILTTFYILLIGTISSWLLEFNNPETIGNMSILNQGVNSFFQTVTMRTAGFASLNYQETHRATNLIYIIQMVIGGGPGGTAGGIKVTTFAILFTYLRAELTGRTYLTIFKRSLTHDIFRRAMSVFFFYSFALLIGWFLLLLSNPRLDSFDLLFEGVSALSTVGVSANLTGLLNRFGQAVIVMMMFLGRVGPLTVFMSLSLRQHQNSDIKYADADLLIG